MRVYGERKDLLSAITWASTEGVKGIQDLQDEGLFDPEGMPDVLTSMKASEIKEAYSSYLALCGEMMKLITPKEKPGKRKHASP